MKCFSLIGLLLIGLLFTLTECQKKSDTQPQNQPADTTDTGNNNGTAYNKSDTTVILRNGRITITIPAGAMKEGTKVSTDNSDIKFIDTAHQLHQFELKPAGTTFKKPVTLTFHYDKAWLKGNSPWNIGIAYKDDEDGKWYPAVNGEVDTVKHTISIKTKHFSHWCIYTCFHLYMKADGQYSEDGSKTIVMQKGDKGLLLVTMDEPPAWKKDPDKDKEFSHPLVANLGAPPLINPKEPYSKSLDPDRWRINGIPNGDDKVGMILFAKGKDDKLYQYLAPAQLPENQPIFIKAYIRTVKHGRIVLTQPVKIVSYGYMPSSDIVLESYVTNNGGTINSEVSSVASGNTIIASVITHTTVGGITVTSTAIDTYDGIKTTIKSTPTSGALRESYNRVRNGIDSDPYNTNVDTSLTVGPYHFVIPDGLASGSKISTSGSVTMYIDYINTMPPETTHKHSVLISYNKDAVVTGYDSLKTNAGTFWCLKVKYDYIVADTLKVIAGGTLIIDHEKATVFPTTEWLARGIGLVKSKTYDPTEGITTIITLDEIKRE